MVYVQIVLMNHAYYYWYIVHSVVRATLVKNLNIRYSTCLDQVFEQVSQVIEQVYQVFEQVSQVYEQVKQVSEQVEPSLWAG